MPRWYKMPRDFALVVADGPPGDVKGGRFGLLPLLREHFAPGAVVLLDDAERPKERDVLAKWASEFGLAYRTQARGEKEWAICSFSAENGTGKES